MKLKPGKLTKKDLWQKGCGMRSITIYRHELATLRGMTPEQYIRQSLRLAGFDFERTIHRTEIASSGEITYYQRIQ